MHIPFFFLSRKKNNTELDFLKCAPQNTSLTKCFKEKKNKTKLFFQNNLGNAAYNIPFMNIHNLYQHIKDSKKFHGCENLDSACLTQHISFPLITRPFYYIRPMESVCIIRDFLCAILKSQYFSLAQMRSNKN